MKHARLIVALAVLAVTPVLANRAFGEGEALGALAKMPVREVTVFKDGHAFVLHAGTMNTDERGNVVLDQLPQPVIGTFWPYAGEKSVAKMSAVTVNPQKVKIERAALTTQEMIEANIGAEVLIKEFPEQTTALAAAPGAEYAATIVGIPERSGEELDRTDPAEPTPHVAERGPMVLLKTSSGTKVVEIARIAQVTFKGEQKKTFAHEELRNLMTMKLEWPDGKPQKSADVGMVYLQKGIRWIPNYRVNIDGKGEATIKLQATLINELVDLEDVSANLVIGVPSFAFAGVKDPMAIEEIVAQLSEHFSPDSRSGFAFNNSNAIQGQNGGGGNAGGAEAPEEAPQHPQPRPMDLGPEVAGSGKNEDLFVFKVNHVSLKKGARMVVPISEFKIAYKDIYKLELPITPPPEIWRTFDLTRQDELARLNAAILFEHKLRLTNKSDMPLTTAPALILRDGKLVAQGMMMYTAIGGTTDLAMTSAVDIKVEKSDKEAKRTPGDLIWEKEEFTRVDVASALTVTNRLTTPAELEITRYVMGTVDKTDHDATAASVTMLDDNAFAPRTAADLNLPVWWAWYGWPSWWNRFNGVSKISWKVKLEAGKAVELPYEWHYHWR